MTDSPVLYHQRDGIVALTLNRPETLNAMNEAMMAELERRLMALEADATVRAVILTGAGRAFSSGGHQKRDRDADAAAMNMQLVTWRDRRAANEAFVAGTGDALRTWRQP